MLTDQFGRPSPGANILLICGDELGIMNGMEHRGGVLKSLAWLGCQCFTNYGCREWKEFIHADNPHRRISVSD